MELFMERTKPLSFSKLWLFLHSKFTRQRTYILPTLFGIYFTFLCLVLLSVAFIHNNNVAYFSVFMLASLGFITMFQTNFNMDRLKISFLPFPETHAEHPIAIKILIENKSSQPIYQLHFYPQKSRFKEKKYFTELAPTKIEVPYLAPKEKKEIEFILIFSQRGHHYPPSIVVETYFPLGLLRSWKILRAEQPILIYPAKKGSLPLPSLGKEGPEGDIQNEKAHHKGSEFMGHREYHPSDSLRHIDWKAYAREQKLHIKLFENEEQGTQLLSWRATQSLGDTEKRLSQLVQWVSACQKQKKNFILEIPRWKSHKMEPTNNHVQECFRALALYEKMP